MANFIKRFFCVLILVAATVPWADAADSIARLGGARPVKGEVTSQNPNQVTVRLKVGIDEEVPVNEIKSLRYDDEPDALKDARSRYANRKYQEVLSMLRSVNAGGIERTMIRQDIDYLKAASGAHLAIGGVGAATKAAATMQQFLKDYPQSYHTYEANELMGQLAVAAGMSQKAEAFYQKAKAPWPESELRLNLLRAKAFAGQKNFNKAIAAYQMVLDSSEQGEQANRAKLKATLGKASALAEIGQGEQGIDSVKKVIRSSGQGDDEMQAQAYNALGNCYRAMQQPKEAVLQYLHTDTLYFQDPEAHAEALGRLAKLWDQLKKSERAAQARKTLNTRYPNSKWNK